MSDIPNVRRRVDFSVTGFPPWPEVADDSIMDESCVTLGLLLLDGTVIVCFIRGCWFLTVGCSVYNKHLKGRVNFYFKKGRDV